MVGASTRAVLGGLLVLVIITVGACRAGPCLS
jgi:hypothetical protein